MVTTACDKLVQVVDDDPDIRDSLSEILEQEGYHILTAANGEEALRQLRGGARPCVILLDLMMPVCNGFEFRSEQQQVPGLDNIPVVVISADGNVLLKATQVGAAAALRKPLGVEQLLDTVERYC